MARALGTKPRLVHVTSDTLVRYQPAWKGPLHGDKSPSSIFDNSKVRALVGPFETTVSLDQGFAGTVEAFKARSASQGPTQDPELDSLVERIIRDQEA